jgi:hypothetical protein
MLGVAAVIGARVSVATPGGPLHGVVAGFCLVVALGALLFFYRNWRCPACDRSLLGTTPDFCPKCGVALR